MPRLPRDMKGTDLAQALSRIGYSIDRRTGSHIRLSVKDERGEHHVTIPARDAPKPGTLNGILGDIAVRLGVGKEELLERLFR
jgi:predicted RNA binding protein YcfA (HicA-like mRNA interferase family)